MYAYQQLPPIPLYVNVAANRPKFVRVNCNKETLQLYDEQLFTQLISNADRVAISSVSEGRIDFKCPEYVQVLLRVKRAISLLKNSDNQEARHCLIRMIHSLKDEPLFVSFLDLYVDAECLSTLLLTVGKNGHIPRAAYVDAYHLFAFSFKG